MTEGKYFHVVRFSFAQADVCADTKGKIHQDLQVFPGVSEHLITQCLAKPAADHGWVPVHTYNKLVSLPQPGGQSTD